MKNIRISSFILILIVIFFMIDFTGYRVLSNHIVSDHEKDTKILFYEMKNQTSNLLTKLLNEYHTQKEQLKNKHKIVLEYMNRHDLNVNLDEIKQQINQGHADKPYNIYITDKNLVIINSTYKDDIGFDLSFAKSIFEKHKAENILGCSAPIREKISKNFLSFTDSYLSKEDDDKSAVLQVSYTYKDTTQELTALQKLIKKHPSIKDIRSYSVSSSGHTYEIILKETDTSYKPDLHSIAFSEEKAIIALKKLNYNDFIENRMVYSATIRELEIIGEAAGKLSQSLKEDYPNIDYSIDQPEGSVLIVLAGHEPDDESYLEKYTEGERINMLIWFPEEYRDFDLGWWWGYFLHRETLGPYWNTEGIVYFPKSPL